MLTTSPSPDALAIRRQSLRELVADLEDQLRRQVCPCRERVERVLANRERELSDVEAAIAGQDQCGGGLAAVLERSTAFERARRGGQGAK